MINLVGTDNANKAVREELAIAKVPGVIELPSPMRTEVETNVIAVFDAFGCRYLLWRKHTYWVVQGLVPLAIAQKLHADPDCRKTTRADGLCYSENPESVARWYVGQQPVLSVATANELGRLGVPTDGRVISDNPENLPHAHQAVDGYSIHSQLGLCRFIEILLGAQ
jgi:hypothetical protein